MGIRGKIFETRELGAELEFTTKIRENGCVFAYYILEGNGSFDIEGEKEKCREGNLVFIPKGKGFRYFGKMKLLLVSAPWWSPEQEETLSD